MLIAVDAMGGDYAPAEIVKGAIEGSELHDVNIVLIGDEEAIKKHIPSKCDFSRITIKHTDEVVEMDDPVDCVRTKKSASLVLAAKMVKDGAADAMVSVGNTAAAMTAGTLYVGRIKGISRPAISIIVPTKSGATVLLDVGAVADCTPEVLYEFAVMGKVYAEKVLGKIDPKISLLSIGEEPCKGNELTKMTHELLNNSQLNFIGNIEGRTLFEGESDVIVCDGFTGNVMIKVAEGVMEHFKKIIKAELDKHPLAWVPITMLLPQLKRIRKRFDYSEYGGAPLLGLDGVCIVGHGRSSARAVANAVKAAKIAVEGNVIGAIRDYMS